MLARADSCAVQYSDVINRMLVLAATTINSCADGKKIYATRYSSKNKFVCFSSKWPTGLFLVFT